MENKKHTETASNKTQQKKSSPTLSFIRSIGINAALPILIYHFFIHFTSVSELIAIILTGVPSTIDSIINIARNKRIDVVAGFALTATILSLPLIVLGGDAKLYLIRNSAILGIFGPLILISMLLPKSIMYYSIRQINTGGDNERITEFEKQWQTDPSVRSLIRSLSLIWGIGLILETVLQISLLLILSVSTFLIISPLEQGSFYGFLILLTMLIVKHSTRSSDN